MQEDDAEEGGAKSAEGDGKPKWKKGKTGKWEKTQSLVEDIEKSMSSWEGHSSMASPEEYEAESSNTKSRIANGSKKKAKSTTGQVKNGRKTRAGAAI
eukprot:6181447-Karenia_brevis.AAC.1